MDEYNPYKNMTLRQELEARFDEADRQQKEQDALDYIRNNMQFQPNVTENVNAYQQPTGWNNLPNNNFSFGSSTIGQHIDNAVNQPNGYFQNSNKGSTNNTFVKSNNNLQNNNIPVWDNVKDFAQNAVNAVAPYIPTYYIGYGIGTAQNMLPQIRNNIADAYNIYKDNGLYSLGKKYAEPSVRRALQAKEDIAPLDIPDVNKHQYISCIGSTDGLIAVAETLGGGMAKEITDTKYKLTNPQKRQAYGGVSGVFADAEKDFKNDIIGSAVGYIAGKQNIPDICEFLLHYPINFKW